jgi:hypothetical protein
MTGKVAMSGSTRRYEAPRRPGDVQMVSTALTAQRADPRARGPLDLLDIHELLGIKLQWYGWSRAKSGPFRPRGGKMLIDLSPMVVWLARSRPIAEQEQFNSQRFPRQLYCAKESTFHPPALGPFICIAFRFVASELRSVLAHQGILLEVAQACRQSFAES